MGRLLFLAVSKWNLLFIILKDDGKRWEHLFFFISGREEAAIQPSTHTRVRTRSKASHISVSLPLADGLYLRYDNTFSLTRVGAPHLSFMTNLSVVFGGGLYSGCRNSFLNSVIFLWMIHEFFCFFFFKCKAYLVRVSHQGYFSHLGPDDVMIGWGCSCGLLRILQHPWTSPASSTPISHMSLGGQRHPNWEPLLYTYRAVVQVAD